MNNLNDTIIIVSGLPRSGTSMMMQILEALNISLFVDNNRSPDQNNPRGYFEHIAVKNIENDHDWLKSVPGKAIKIVSHLLFYLPDIYFYKIIFMQRNINEIIRSQNKMLSLANPETKTEDPKFLKNLFNKNIEQVFKWEKMHLNVELLCLNYIDVLNKTEGEVNKIISFLDLQEESSSLNHIVSKDLYRSKILKF